MTGRYSEAVPGTWWIGSMVLQSTRTAWLTCNRSDGVEEAVVAGGYVDCAADRGEADEEAVVAEVVDMTVGGYAGCIEEWRFMNWHG